MNFQSYPDGHNNNNVQNLSKNRIKNALHEY